KRSVGFTQNELASGGKIAVEINCTHNCFEGISQSGSARPPAASFLPSPHQQMATEIECLSVGLERFTRNQTGAQFSQPAFLFVRKMRIEVFRDYKLQNRIAQKFQALIVVVITLFFVAETGMR